MSSAADAIADAVATAFAGGFAASPRLVSQDIAVARVHLLDMGVLESLPVWSAASPPAKAIKVFVRAGIEQAVLSDGSRGARMVTYPIQIAIACKAASILPVDVDPLKQVSQELRDWFYKRGNTLPGRDEGIAGDPDIFFDADEESLRQSSLFLSEFVISFLGQRNRQ